MKKLFITILLLIIALPARAYQPAVVSAHPEASRVGMNILKKGGNSADAAIATAFALGVVEPFNSGVGGGGFLLYYDAKSKKYSFVDYREVAPGAASEEFYRKNPSRLHRGILSVAVPGFVKGMETIHKKWGLRAWDELIYPAIDLARKGMPIRGKLKEKISRSSSQLKEDPAISAIYLEPFEKAKGEIVQADLADTLEAIRKDGAKGFYSGPLAKEISGFMKKNGGLISAADLRNYQVFFRKPYQFEREPYEIISAPPPSAGGAAIALLFKKAIINNLSDARPFSPAAFDLVMRGIKDYFYYREIALGDTSSNIATHTTHLSVIDKEGNIASMTNTLNSPFGSGVVVPGTGIILNNEMADFSLKPGSPNAIRPGRRPLSSMSPSIVLRKGKPYIVIGTPGGFNIPVNLFQVFLFMWDWKASLGGAIAKPKIYYSPTADKILAEPEISKGIREALAAQGTIEEQPSTGNVQALIIQNEKRTLTISDPRGEGKGFAD
ncbi:MAG: gamma-glutamyltransferase family protein [Deltaproteobacteria bacterium]|nr:gamma-glutamyltransferase family protein [Deltaproteobacteria bacterium]